MTDTLERATDNTNPEDLEDGEIESDGEGVGETNAKEEITAPPPEQHPPKPEKKKKSKSHSNKDEKKKDKHKKKHPSPVEDDFAGNIEKAIRRAMKNESNDHDLEPMYEMDEEENNREALKEDFREGSRKNKKRKKRDGAGPTSKKRKKKRQDEDDINDEEMMFTRGASPVRHSTSPRDYQSDDSYGSNASYEEHRHHHNRQSNQRNRPPVHLRKNAKNVRDRRPNNMHPMQDPDGVCIYFMQGKCHKGDDCVFSHDAEPPRKMELCKFYLMDCCAKRDKCLYMHSDFPCKYYYTGLPCVYNDECKFAHGPPLTDNLKSILLKHIESAPKEILGDFPRLSRETATMMITTTHMRLIQQFSSHNQEMRDMPSMFDMNAQNQNNSDDNMQNSGMHHHFNNFQNEKCNKNMQRVRQSRWQQSNSVPNIANIVGNPSATKDVLSIKNLTGVLTPRQISDLNGLGIENLNQLSQLTVIQLNQLGLNLKQINEIQLNTLSIQNLGLIDGGEQPKGLPSFSNAGSVNKDLDMRVAPPPPEVVAKPVMSTDAFGHDIDMRFQSTTNHTGTNNSSSKPHDPRVNKDTIDIDQYTKDALKFASKEKENIDNMSTDIAEDEDLVIDIPKTKDVDQRVLQFVKDTPVAPLSDADTDIRFLHPDNFMKKPAKRHRRSTTDDEDNNLLIDEKCYSSDEDKSFRTKSPKQSPRPVTPPIQSSNEEPPSSVLNKLGDLSKIDISDEITKLLNTMKNKTQESMGKSPSQEHSKPRDPRSLPKKSPDHKSPSVDFTKTKKVPKISIYECVEGEPTDGRKRTDVDLRQLDPDFRLPAFGDTDFRQNTSSGDIDFRYGLPFKPLPNYTPATEIDGSINTHPPIQYKLKTVDIPRPDYTDIKNSTAKSQAMTDPRLRKLFRLSIDEPSSDGEKSSKVLVTPRADPRKKPTVENMEQPKHSLDLQNVTNSSAWYKELSTNQKIFVNQQLATVTSLIKKHQLEKHLGKPFDKSQIIANPILCSIFNNLGVAVDDNGDVTYLNKTQDALLKSPPGFSSNPDNFGANLGMMNPQDSMSMMNNPSMPMPMGPMGNMNMNPMPGFNSPFSNPEMRPAPGLLGYAPNMPHRFDGPNFCPPNFAPDGFHMNMPTNGSVNEEAYHRNQNRGNYRGRWNRGSGNRGNRDRRNYEDRGGGGWANDRNN